jgi:hypothetical protein
MILRDRWLKIPNFGVDDINKTNAKVGWSNWIFLRKMYYNATLQVGFAKPFATGRFTAVICGHFLFFNPLK